VWGADLDDVLAEASDAARENAKSMMSSARSAAAAVASAAEAGARKAAAAAELGARKAAEVAEAGARKAAAAAVAVKDAAVAGAQGVGNVASFGARAGAEVAGGVAKTAVDVALAPFRAARALFSPSKPPTATAVEPCPATAAAKIERLERRNQLIAAGKRSGDPAKLKAAERLARNNEAVELARLSSDSYSQYPGPEFKYPTGDQPKPPPGWNVVPASELEAKGVSVKDLEAARAVVYRTPDNWPGGAKTVVSFRGTADLEDGIVDHDQAMSVPTTQYKAAMRVGDSMSQGFGPDVQVTGHSLGGGKAQAAGAAGGLKGTMFNSAGLHPATTGGQMPPAAQFSQFRTTGDPLTGTQNSPATQAAIATVAGGIGMPAGALMKAGNAAAKAAGFGGLSPEMADYADKAFKAFPRGVKNMVQNGEVMPPAIGAIHEVPAVNDKGQEVSKFNLAGQHSITSAVNGIESQKEDDLGTLK
jgi:hypothetical protein